jgi:hypothetical protein
MDSVYRGWLRRRLTVREAEERNLVHHRALGGDAVPFGFRNNEWRALLAKIADGDEIWEFRNSESSWQLLRGRAGVALVRDGEVIDVLITSLS